MLGNNPYPASVFNDYFSNLNIADALNLSALLNRRVYSDSDDSVLICLCHPADDTRSEALCKVLRGLRDVASSMGFRFVFHVHADSADLGVPLDIFRISMSSSFYALVSEHMVNFVKSRVD